MLVASAIQAAAVRCCALALCACALSGCGLHLYRQEDAKLAQSAKTTFAEKIDLVGVVATERANLAQQREAELGAVRQSRLHERDLVFFNAAQLGGDARFLVLGLPATKESCAPKELLKQRYVARRACELKIATPEEMRALVNAEGDVYRSKVRHELVAESRADLQTLGWTQAPKCDGIPVDSSSDGYKAKVAALENSLKENVETKQQEDAEAVLEELVANCRALNGFRENLNKSAGLKTDLDRLKALQDEEQQIADASKQTAAELKNLAERLDKLAAGQAKEGETRSAIAADAKKLRERLDKAQDYAAKLGIQEALADFQIDAAATLLQALEGEQIPEEKLKGEDGLHLRRAVLVAQTAPQLAEEMKMIQGQLTVPPKSSLLIAQRQALLDKENIAARKAYLDKRIDLVRRRISLIVEEARLLQLAAAQTSAAGCKEAIARDEMPPEEIKVAEAQCERGQDDRLLVGFYFLSRAMLGARSGQEATRWDEVYLMYEQNLAAKEYAIQSWNNLVGTPIVFLEAYHSGGVKVEVVSDLIFKATGLGLLGIAVHKVD